MAGTESSPDGRKILSYDEYSRALIKILTEYEAPRHVRVGVIAMDQWIANDKGYKAPEAINSARDKTKLFATFCSLDSEPELRQGWQLKAAEFFEKHT